LGLITSGSPTDSRDATTALLMSTARSSVESFL